MKANEITIDVKANLQVDRSTAETCLKLVEMFVNDTGINVVATKTGDCANSHICFSFEDKAEKAKKPKPATMRDIYTRYSGYCKELAEDYSCD